MEAVRVWHGSLRDLRTRAYGCYPCSVIIACESQVSPNFGKLPVLRMSHEGG